MAEYIGCRKCDSPDCKGCNLKNLETMLNNGKFDCLMNENRCINPDADVTPVRHGRWMNANSRPKTYWRRCTACGGLAYFCGIGCSYKYCPNCGCRMDGGAD